MAFRWQQLLILRPGSLTRGRMHPRKFFGMVVLLLGLLFVFSQEVRYRIISFLTYPLHYKEYKHFGIRLPKGYVLHGIDVSRYQSKVDWKRVRNMKVGDVRISFAFIKATEGSWIKDPQYFNNWDEARENKIIRGAYHYFLPNVSARDQARHFIKTVRLRSGDLPPVVDVEEARGVSKAELRKYTLAFLQLLEKNYGVKPILYTNRDFYKNYFADVEEFKDYRLWIAHYHVSDLDVPGDADWDFWQHSDRGTVNGINERVDFNVFNGDSAELRKLCVP